MSLNTSVGTLSLQTPLLLASGYITETPDFFFRAVPYGCAGMVTRSLKEHVPPERASVPAPRYVVFNGNSMLNCEWGNEKPWRHWLVDALKVKETGCPIIVSLSGRDIEGCANLIRSFDEISVDAFEINISCSHSGVLHGNLNIDVTHLRELMEKIRPITRTPLWIKLSYSTILIQMAEEAERLGADAIVCTNSIGPGMFIDTDTAKPKLGIKDGGGGVTGKAIFPIALWSVHQIHRAVAIPIVGSGGISTADDVIQMLMAGAAAVELYTAPALKGPAIFRRIVSGLEKFLREHPDYHSLNNLVGAAKIGEESNFSSPTPMIIEENCTGCGICIPSCAFDAIKLVHHPKALAIIDDNCISCNACVGVCPPKFDAIQASY